MKLTNIKLGVGLLALGITLVVLVGTYHLGQLHTHVVQPLVSHPSPLILPDVSELLINADGSYTLPAADTTGVIDEQGEQQMLVLVNQARVTAGLVPLAPNNLLNTIARDYSQAVLATAHFSHNDINGNTPFKRMADRKVAYKAAAENLGLGATVQEVFDGLMRSPGHRENILNGTYTQIGLGIIKSHSYGYMVTQEFIKP